VCDDIACRVKGAEGLCRSLESTFGPAGSGDEGTWKRSPCLGYCEQAPVALVQQAGAVPAEHTITHATLPVLTAAVSTGAVPEPFGLVVPQADAPRDPLLRLLRRVGVADPGSLDDYRAHGGYQALRRALEVGPEAVLREISDSKLLGRGGAAFPTGRKWEAVARSPVRPHYLVCNADESEPGTFKDRVLMEEDPFALVEAIALYGLVIAFIIRGLKEFGEPTRKALIMDLAPEDKKAGMFGLYYLIRDVVVSISAMGGAFLWQASPTANLLVAAACGLAGTVYFWVFGKDLKGN